MFKTALFLIPSYWENPKMLVIHEWINNLWNNFLLAIKRKKKLLIHTILWISLKNIMPSKGNQKQKAIYCMILFIWNSMREKYRDRNKLKHTWGRGWVTGEIDYKKAWEKFERCWNWSKFWSWRWFRDGIYLTELIKCTLEKNDFYSVKIIS